MIPAGTASKALIESLGLRRPEGGLALLPDPGPRPVYCPVISVDDHLLEPPELFVDRVPARFRDAAPRVVEGDDGLPVWLIDGKQANISGANAASGRPVEEWLQTAVLKDEMRPGVWNVDYRVRDMDLNGVWASLCFPAIPFGFAGTVFSLMDDADLGLACVQAYNDWVVEEWTAPHPERLIPCQVSWFRDPVAAADEVRRNSARGFKTVSFSESPEALGFPGLYSGHWDPFFRACEETETVISLHVGSSGLIQRPSSESPTAVVAALFPLNGMIAVVDWIYAKLPIRFPGLKIAMSEAGATWVPMIVEKLDRLHRTRAIDGHWRDADPHPVELLRRNFWFTSIEDPGAFRNLDVIGRDRVMIETDYPHFDSTWPDTQALLQRDLGHLAPDDVRAICYGTAAALYRHPEPPTSWIEGSLLGAATPSCTTRTHVARTEQPGPAEGG